MIDRYPGRTEKRREQYLQGTVRQATEAWFLVNKSRRLPEEEPKQQTLVAVSGGAMRIAPTLVAEVVDELTERIPSFADAVSTLSVWQRVEFGGEVDHRHHIRTAPVPARSPMEDTYLLVHHQTEDQQGTLVAESLYLSPMPHDPPAETAPHDASQLTVV